MLPIPQPQQQSEMRSTLQDRPGATAHTEAMPLIMENLQRHLHQADEVVGVHGGSAALHQSHRRRSVTARCPGGQHFRQPRRRLGVEAWPFLPELLTLGSGVLQHNQQQAEVPATDRETRLLHQFGAAVPEARGAGQGCGHKGEGMVNGMAAALSQGSSRWFSSSSSSGSSSINSSRPTSAARLFVASASRRWAAVAKDMRTWAGTSYRGRVMPGRVLATLTCIKEARRSSRRARMS